MTDAEEIARDDPLHQAAIAVERDRALAAEMDEWEVATIDDGWGGTYPPIVTPTRRPMP